VKNKLACSTVVDFCSNGLCTPGMGVLLMRFKPPVKGQQIHSQGGVFGGNIRLFSATGNGQLTPAAGPPEPLVTPIKNERNPLIKPHPQNL